MYLSTHAHTSPRCLAGCWSPSRPAVIYLTDQAGNLEIWDMLDRSHEPSIKVCVRECMCVLEHMYVCVCVCAGGHMCVSTCAYVSTHVCLRDCA